MTLKVLIVDDEALFREDVAAALRDKGYECQTASNGEEALVEAGAFQPDVVLCDLVLPRMRGLDVLRRANTMLPETHFIMVTAHATLDSAIQALREGAADYLLKPIDLVELEHKLHLFAERLSLKDEVRVLRRTLSEKVGDGVLIGMSAAILRVREMIERLAGTPCTVLLRGETGTGKEVVARRLHDLSCRPGQPFVAVNCAAIPESLWESEFFGYRRGAFTGADRDKIGYFEAANGGTLFLDEIGELSPTMQAKLLRALEDRVIYRVGSTEPTVFQARIVAATNRDLLALTREGKFREDLYYRIRVVEIDLPPLRERADDIPLLLDYFARRLGSELKRNILGVSNEAVQAALVYNWPGNVRELRNAVERAMLFTHEGYLPLVHFPPELQAIGCQQLPQAQPLSLKEALRQFEKRYIKSVLAQTGGNRDEAARLLGVDRSTLYRKLSV